MPYYFNDRRYRSWVNFKSEIGIGKSIPFDKLLKQLQTSLALLSWIYEESPYFDYENVGKHLHIKLSAREWIETFRSLSPKPWKEILEEMFGKELFSEIEKEREKAERIERNPESGTPEDQKKDLTVDDIKYKFHWCPPGEFMMGGEKLANEKPPHKVQLTKGFWMLETQVTQEMWESVMDESINTKAKKSRGKDLKGTGDKYPMYYISWDDCQAFCKKLNEKLEEGQKVQLPTEAQWEYACRAGTTGDYAGDIDSMAWHYDNSGSKTNEVGKKDPNSWGLYDMHGNVWEWCSDYYDKNYYQELPKPAIDPENKTESQYHVSRGGCWDTKYPKCRSAYRLESPSEPDCKHGFRILLVHNPKEIVIW